MTFKVDILCNDGSPLRVTEASIWGDDGRLGVGGAELALLTMCRGWHDRGYDVTLYNNPDNPENSIFKQRTIVEFDPYEDRDVLIIFRSPSNLVDKFTVGLKVWWSCDQMTVGDFRQWAKQVDKIVTISRFHASYFKMMYGIENTITIDLPVRDDYDKPVEKIPQRCAYTSIPDRGVMQLNAAWPLIVRDVPNASLVITSDWRLWDADIDQSVIMPYKVPFARQPNVSYFGAVKREKLIELQLSSELLLYPCVYDELYCIAVAEAQVAGAIPITSQFGALKTTNEFGLQIEGSPFEPEFITKFATTAIMLLKDPHLKERQEEMQEKARKRFALSKILDEWDRRVFGV